MFEYLTPTMEAAEVHSMAMEYLAWPHAERFFDAEEARRFRRIHLEQRVLALPYMAAVDHFQHDVYARPGMRPAERHARWRELERAYLPHREYDGALERFAAGGLWQRQRHVYAYPFYNLDDAVAQACALQLWARAQSDRAGAVEAYVALSAASGSRPFDPLVALAGLRSPFEPGCLADAVTAARRYLDAAAAA